MKCWAASDENIFFLLLNSATEFHCFTRGKLQSLHFWVFNNHTKSLYLLCSFGSRPENFLFCCRHFCQTADVDKTELQKKKGGALIFPPLTFTVLLLIRNSAVYLYLSWNAQTPPAMYCILKICWFICKDCARWNRKILLKTPSYQSRAYLACLNSVVPFSLCPRWLWKAHHVSVSS